MEIAILTCAVIGVVFLMGVHYVFSTREHTFGSRTQRNAIKVKLRELDK